MKKKIISLLIALAMALSVPACLAEGSGSSNADDFLANLGKTWDSFVGMVGDAGQSAADWANENGVTDWVNGAVNSVSDWAQNSGVTDWVNGAVSDVAVWAYDSGVVDWAQSALDSFAAWAGASTDAWSLYTTTDTMSVSARRRRLSTAARRKKSKRLSAAAEQSITMARFCGP